MQLTSFSILDSEELVKFVQLNGSASEMEIELAQRMILMLDLLDEHGLNERDESQSSV